MATESRITPERANERAPAPQPDLIDLLQAVAVAILAERALQAAEGANTGSAPLMRAAEEAQDRAIDTELGLRIIAPQDEALVTALQTLENLRIATPEARPRLIARLDCALARALELPGLIPIERLAQFAAAKDALSSAVAPDQPHDDPAPTSGPE
ncbi:hypothetical protein PUH89_13755 [Rhodobacter capsulatus]|uniref:Uncharacterized protein n=1 Tax=Rhodobacter capsulatus TaxID=1061 RepID=A0A1G7T842_RHOCA|nr:hypothetical protein [Rhodobacter capsulatus]WER08376.1 hypothetical protein PUH89_13755 [Rhodobacter capsulatus]SDG31483.1 hypothetical protein SAMN04244550_03759 [Rhodobacter capsulatus]